MTLPRSMLRRTIGEDGQTLVEYAMILMFVAVLLVGVILLFSQQLSATYSSIVSQMAAY